MQTFHETMSLTFRVVTGNNLVYENLRISLLSLESFLWDIDKQNSPNVTPQNAASHLGLFCLLTGISLKNEIKMKNYS